MCPTCSHDNNINIDNDGLRLTFPAPSGTGAVWMFGGSAMWGSGVADEETIYHVRSTNGVGDFIGGEMNAPQPLSEREVEQMLGVAETSTEEPKLEINFKKGQNVKIKNGPFDGYSGTVDEVQPAKGAIRVIVTIFGRATPITLEYWEVESI